MSTYVGGTGGMIQYVEKTQHKTYLVATDDGMIHRLSKLYPDRLFVLAAKSIQCKDMKKISLQKILDSLRYHTLQIEIDPHIASAALKAIQNMLDISKK
jgi:quinolinate synthase